MPCPLVVENFQRKIIKSLVTHIYPKFLCYQKTQFGPLEVSVILILVLGQIMCFIHFLFILGVVNEFINDAKAIF